MKKNDLDIYLDITENAPTRTRITDLFSEPKDIDADYWINSLKNHISNATYFFISGATTKIDQIAGLRDLAVAAMTPETREDVATRYEDLLRKNDSANDLLEVAAAALLTRNLSPLNALYAASGQPSGIELIQEARAELLAQSSDNYEHGVATNAHVDYNSAMKMQ